MTVLFTVALVCLVAGGVNAGIVEDETSERVWGVVFGVGLGLSVLWAVIFVVQQSWRFLT